MFFYNLPQIFMSESELKSYLKYYNLEDYLFDDIHNNFIKNKCLDDYEFFAIVCWKRKATAIKVAKRWNGEWNKDRLSIQDITSKVYLEPDDMKKMEILKNINQVGVAIASAILTVCYPEKFTIIDYRALNSLRKKEKKKCENEKLPQKAENFKIEDYINYNNICKEVWNKYCPSLRDFDRCLWTMDWCDGEKGLKEVVETYTKNLGK